MTQTPSELRARLDAARGPGLVKTRASMHRTWKLRSTSEFRAAFLACGLSEAEFARELGITRQYVNDLLKGRRDVPDWITRGMPRAGREEDIDGRVRRLEEEPVSEAS